MSQKITVDFFSECMAKQKQDSLISGVYDPDKMMGISEEAGRAIERVQTIYVSETMALQSKINNAASGAEIIMVAEGLFEKGGFFSNIWETIVKAFRAVADFVGGLFNKLTGATEKNLKALKDAWILFETDEKYKKLLDAQDSSVSLKKDSFVKIPKNAVATPLIIATVEGNAAIKDMKGTQLQSLEIPKGNNIYELFDTKISTAAKKLSSSDSFQSAGFGGDDITKAFQNINSGNLRPTSEPEKAVKKTIAAFIKAILAGSAGSKVETGEIGVSSTDGSWRNLVTGEVSTKLGKYVNKSVELFTNTYNNENANDTDLRTIFGCLSTLKNINKPEDVADIRDYVTKACKIEGEIRVEGEKIKDLMGYMATTYYGCINGKYDNLVKFFQDGKEKFTLLADKYEDIAKDFKGAVNTAANNQNSDMGTNEQNARTAANALTGLVSDSGDLSKFTMFFSQLSLKWYSVVDGLLGVGVANFYNLIKIVKDSLDKNTVEIV